MAEAAGSTFGLFYVMDFAKDKCRLLRKYGTEFNTTPEIALKFAYITSGVIGSIFCGYPFKMLAKYVDELPKNA